MGWFDFLKKKAPAPPPEGEKTAARGPQESGEQRPQETTTVPEGHEVILHNAMPEPSVTRSRGGVVLANFGVGGDDTDSELDETLRGIGAMLEEDGPPANLVNVNREMKLSELFAPADPEILRFPSPVSWIFHQGSAESLCADPRRLQALLRCMFTIGAGKGGAIRQAVYLVGPPSPSTLTFVRLARGLGVEVKQPDDEHGGLSVLAEVKRPEGPILCVLTGKPYPGDEPADPYARKMNEEKAWAADAGHDSVLVRLQEQELSGLAERLGPAEGRPQIVLRAPRLRKVILALEAGAEGGMEALLQVLLSRSAPLFCMKNKHDNGMEVRDYGAAGSALPMFSDLRCLEWAAEDLGKKPGSFAIAGIHPQKLIAMAAGGKMGIAIGTYRNRKTPVYAILPGSLVKSVAKELEKN